MERKFLSVRQASKYSSLSQRLLYDIIARKEIRSYRIHKRIVIAAEDLETFIGQGIVEREDWNEKAREFLK